jgi:hypothetical protein
LLNHPTLDRLREPPPPRGQAWPRRHGKGVPRSGGQPRKPRPRTRRMARSAGRSGGHAASAKAVRGTNTHRQAAASGHGREPALGLDPRDVDFRKPRGLDRTLFLHLASCDCPMLYMHDRSEQPARLGLRAPRDAGLRYDLVIDPTYQDGTPQDISAAYCCDKVIVTI